MASSWPCNGAETPEQCGHSLGRLPPAAYWLRHACFPCLLSIACLQNPRHVVMKRVLGMEGDTGALLSQHLPVQLLLLLAALLLEVGCTACDDCHT